MLIFLVECGERDTRSRFKYGDLYVLADTNDFGKVKGSAMFYNAQNQLVKLESFTDGIKNGPSINYSETGKVTDSVNYVYGRQAGYWYFYDSSGKLTSREYYYSGKQLGHLELYDSNKIVRTYSFKNFEKHDNVYAKYDDQVKLREMERFDMQFSARNILVNGKQMINVFSYLPKPPYCDVEFHIGLNKSENESENLFQINNAVFIDTLLPKLDSNWEYFISCHIKQPSGTFDRVYIAEYGKPRDTN